jgi:hypothetical protein
MTCIEAERHIHEALDEGLTAWPDPLVEHFATCEACRELAAELALLTDVARTRSAHMPPDEYFGALGQRLARQAASPFTPRQFRISLAAAAGLAALMVLSGLAAGRALFPRVETKVVTVPGPEHVVYADSQAQRSAPAGTPFGPQVGPPMSYTYGGETVPASYGGGASSSPVDDLLRALADEANQRRLVQRHSLTPHPRGSYSSPFYQVDMSGGDGYSDLHGE